MTHNYRACCIHCGDPTGCEFATCGRCAQLLEGIEDVTVEPPPRPPTREPGGDDQPQFTTIIACSRGSAPPAPKPKDAKWLVWAANKRGCLRWFHLFGQSHGYPRNIYQWSPAMVAVAIAAKTDDCKTPAH